MILVKGHSISTKIDWFCQRWRITGNLAGGSQTEDTVLPELPEEARDVVLGRRGVAESALPKHPSSARSISSIIAHRSITVCFSVFLTRDDIRDESREFKGGVKKKFANAYHI